jgi:zinc protease
MQPGHSARQSLPGADDTTRAVLPNGITIIARENFLSSSVVINGVLPVGSAYEPAAQGGLSSMVAASLMRGTASRDFDAIHETLESLGATLGVGSGTLHTSFGGKALVEDLPVILSLLSDALREPTFPTDQVERLRGETLTGLRMRAKDARSVANDEFRRLCYPSSHPFSRNTSGEVETVSALSIADMAAYHKARYIPAGMVIVIVGAIERQAAIDQVAAVFENWASPADAQPHNALQLSAPPLTTIAERRTVLAGKSQSELVLGWPGPARSAADYQAALIANNIFGVFGMMGRLGKSVREDQGLAYSCGSRFSGGIGPGPWTVNAGVNPANVEQALVSIRREIRRMTDELVSPEEIEDVKANFIGRLPLGLETNEGVASTLLNIELHGLGMDYLRQYAALIRAVSRDQVQHAAQHYLSADRYALAISGPALPSNQLTGALQAAG